MKFNYITPPVNIMQVPFRVLSTLIVKLIAPLPITPNQVTYFRAGVVSVGLWLMAEGTPRGYSVGALLFYCFEVLDHVDGDLARFTNQKSKLGPLLEQFQDTLFARPANLLGIALAVGLFRMTGSSLPIILFAVCAYGRMNWMEFRDYFGWHRNLADPPAGYVSIMGGGSLYKSIVSLAKILYTWNNSFILIPALFFYILPYNFSVIFMYSGMVTVVLLNNLPWIGIVAKGFYKASQAGRRDEI